MTCPILSQSEIFFMISSVGFMVVGILAAIFLIYLIRVMRTFSRMADKLEKNIGNIGESAEEMVDDVRDSNVYRLLFGKKKRKRKE